MSPDPSRRPDKRVAIRAAARELFRRFGVKKTSMREIAKAAGVAVGTLYLYFPSKDDLVLACVELYEERHRLAAAELLRAELPSAEKLRRYMLERFRASEDTRRGSPFARELTAAVLRVDPQRLHDAGQAMVRVIAAILSEGQARGELHPESVQGDAEVFLTSCAWFFPNALTPLSREPREEDLLRLTDWFLRRWSER